MVNAGHIGAAVRGPVAAGRPERVNALVDSLGLGCYIAWSYVFWDSPLLLDGPLFGSSLAGTLLLAQGICTALAALVLMLFWGRVAPFRRNLPVLGVFTAMEVGAVVLAAMGQMGAASACAVAGFASSGAGSAMRLGWEERMSVRGVRATAARAALGYLMGTALYSVVVFLPSGVALAVTGALPLVSLGLLVYQERRRPDEGVVVADPALEPVGVRASFRACFERVPWRIPAFVVLSYFCYGATRMNSLSGALASAHAPGALVVAIAMLACFTGIVLAYVSYRKSVQVGICIAVPIMAAAGLCNVVGVPRAGVAVLFVANVGVEITKYLMLFLMIDVIIKDGAPALLCLALLRFAQWGGSALGQVGADALSSNIVVAVAMLLVLMAALMLVIGVFPAGLRVGARSPASASTRLGSAAPRGGMQRGAASGFAGADGPSREDARSAVGPAGGVVREGSSRVVAPGVREAYGGSAPSRSVAVASERYGLSPRETEVLGIWATGRPASYVEKVLFISQNTVKTHLNHIYAKTGTANRSELLELLDSIDEIEDGTGLERP